MQTVDGIEALSGMVGQELGWSDWHTVTQEQVNQFADATGDHQWIHVDPERAKAGPFGGPIAHGFLTLSLAPTLMSQVMKVQGVRMGVNYGLNRVRFPAPVAVGSRVRLGMKLASVEPIEGGVQCVNVGTFEIEGGTKPVCVAEMVVRYYT
jgi:acyl dehydratase